MRILFNLSTVLFMLCMIACQQVSRSGIATSEAGNSSVPVTTIYIVRHAEKETANPEDKDPDLTLEGKARAEALRSLLKDKAVDAVYTTQFKRTMNTLKPLADERHLKILTYESSAYEFLKTQIMQNFTGKTVVVVGHSNTIVPMAKAFGVEPPVTEVPDSKYDHIFKITITADNNATLEAEQYGQPTN